MITVHQIGRTFVKSTRFTNPETVEVLESGIRGDRDFFLLESSGAPISSNHHGTFFPLLFDYDFGSDALKFINSPEGRELRLRGVNAHVVVPGSISTGDPVRRVSL